MRKKIAVTIGVFLMICLLFLSCDQHKGQDIHIVRIETTNLQGEIDTLDLFALLEPTRDLVIIKDSTCINVRIYNDSTKTSSITKRIKCGISEYDVFEQRSNAVKGTQLNIN